MISIIIVEDNLKYCEKLINTVIAKNNDLKLVGIVNNSEAFLDKVSKNAIDIILINYNILKDLRTSNINLYKKSIILLFNKKDFTPIVLDNPYIYNYISEKENFNEITKMINALILLKTHSTCMENKSLIYNKIKKELSYLGYNPSYNGTTYICETIYILYTLNNYFDNDLEKDIYPIIANKYHKTVNNIKCNIINATNIMYFDCTEDKLLKYLGDYSLSKPGPKRIIFAILEKIIYEGK